MCLWFSFSPRRVISPNCLALLSRMCIMRGAAAMGKDMGAPPRRDPEFSNLWLSRSDGTQHRANDQPTLIGWMAAGRTDRWAEARGLTPQELQRCSGPGGLGRLPSLCPEGPHTPCVLKGRDPSSQPRPLAPLPLILRRQAFITR